MNKKIYILGLLLLTILSISSVCYAYYWTQGTFEGTTTVSFPSLSPIVNGSNELTQSIVLTNTITNSKNFGPGAEGKFKVDIDFSDIGTDIYYKIYYDNTNIPSNLKFYVDSTFSTELDYIDGIELLENDNKMGEHYIYWKWLAVDNALGNENDSLYMNQEITVPFTVYFSQNMEKHTVIVNDIEKPTGRIDIKDTHVSNNKGLFNIELDFSNVELNKGYRVFFNNNEYSNLHLYSDSNYENEITYLSGINDGDKNITVYWKLENDSLDSLNEGLYYAVVLGSW